MQEIHAAHRQRFGVAVFMGDEVFERAGVEERSDGDEAASLMEVSPEQQFLIYFFYIIISDIVLLHDAAQFVIVLAVDVDFFQQFLILQVIPVLFNQVAVHVGTAQAVAHFQQEDNG